MTGKNGSKILTKVISCNCKCKFDGKKYNSNQKCNNDKCQCECKKHRICKKDYTWSLSTCSWENKKKLASITDDSVITCDEIIDAEITNNEKTKTISTNFNKQNNLRNTNFYVLLVFLLIIIALLLAVTIYFCHVTSQITNQKKFYKCIIKMESNGKLKETDIKNQTCWILMM